MGSTSLSEQLKRLQRPQTSQFVDSRKRPSILYEAKEAAEKDRETIFEIGLSGLQELIQHNADFKQFERTLFDRSSKDLVRSVESDEVNRLLAKQIRKFMHFLSPFFMLQAAHKCLEWLIRRYSIEAYDQDEFVLLILPYHGTRIFVRCVQVLQLSGGNNSRWEWLESVKKSGMPLAKQTLFNRMACDQSLIQAVTKGTINMVKTLGEKAYTLQTALAFYCTSILGCLEYPGKVTESHFTNILPGILKGLASPVVDFASAALIILGELLSRISLASDTLDILAVKLIVIHHPNLQEEAVMTLILLFQSQGSHYKLIPAAALEQLMKSKSFLSTLAELSAAHYRVSPLFVPLLTVCLRRVQEKTADFGVLKNFCESCLSFVVFSDVDAKEVIRCVLSSYVLKEAVEDAVITIDSGDESDIPLSDTNLDVSMWYSGFVRSIERQYPEILSETVKEILAVDSSILSDQRKSSLKAVLGFLLTNSVQEDGHIDLFEGLFHRQSKCRVQAVRTLVSRFEEIQATSERTRDLIRSTLKERLFDDDSRVVCEVLKLSTEVLVQHVGEAEVLKRAFQLLGKSVTKTNNSWTKAKQRFLQHLLGFLSNWTLVSETEMFIQLFPLLMPRLDNEIALFEKLLEDQTVQKKWPVVQKIQSKVKKAGKEVDLERIHEIVQAEMVKQKDAIIPLEELIVFCEEKGKEESHQQVYYALKMMRVEQNKIDLGTGQRILNVLERFVKGKEVVAMEQVTKDTVPVALVIKMLDSLIDGLQLKEKYADVHFGDENESQDVKLLKSLFQQIVCRLFEPSHADEFSKLLKVFFKKMFAEEKEVSGFLANYFSCHKLIVNKVDVETQLMAICVARAMMVNEKEEIQVSDPAMVKILVGLHHESPVIKKEVIKCVEILAEKGIWEKFCGFLVKNKQAILMDHEQIAFVIFNYVSARQKGKAMDETLKGILDVVCSPSIPDYLKAVGLILIRHVNNAEMVRTLSNCVAEVFDRVEKDGGELNCHQMVMIEEIVNRLNQTTLIVTAKNTEIWDKIIDRILSNADLLLQGEKSVPESPFLKLLEVMDEMMFSKLSQEYQTTFLRSCLRNCCTSPKNQAIFSHAVGKLIKAIPVNGKVVERLLEEMIVNPNAQSCKSRPRRGLRIEPATDLLSTENWRRGIVLLEMVQNKNDMANLPVIVPPLFRILKTCIDLDEQNPVEYVKQLVLSSLLHCCQQLQEKINKVDGGLKVDLVVNCIRGSVNPQTHHHALQLICHLAPFAPEIVLQNITDIFTFMGSTIVRRDDAYSFQIILKIIDSVVPILIQKSEGDSGKLVAVLKIFADIILDVPEHRRQAMYVKLFTTLDKQYLWVFVAIVLSNHVLQERKQQESDKSNDAKEDLPKSIRVALSILTEFEPALVVETCCHLMNYMQTIQVVEVGKETKKAVPKRANSFQEALELAIFDSAKSTTRQQKHMKYVLIQFISNTMAAPAFVRAVNGRQRDEEEFKKIKPFYQEFIIKDLMCIASTAGNADVQQKYWKVILHHCYESLNNVIILLTNQMFFAVVEGLLKHTIWTVRKKMLELLVNKLQNLTAEDQAQLTEEDEAGLVRLLAPVEQIILTVAEGKQSEAGGESRTGHEMLIIQQLALIVTKLMGKVLSDRYPEELTKILRILIGLLENRKEIPVVVLSANVLCIADLSVNVGATAIEFLPEFMPIFLEILDTQTYNTTVDTILASMLTALQKIVETFAIFLSAYLVDILGSLSLLSVKLNGIAQKDAKVNATLARIAQMEEKIAKHNPLRILVPAVEAAYKKLIVQPKAVDAIGPLMSVLAKSIAEVTPSEIHGVQEELTAFFLEALQFRSTHGGVHGLTLEELNAIEDRIVATLISLTMKFSESTFKPLYYKIYDWAIRNDGGNAERTITFYRLTSKIAEALKSLFVLFSIDFTNNSASLLDKCHVGKVKDDAEKLFFPNEERKCATLIEGIMSSYLNIFTYDAKKFMDAGRFETLCNVMVDQLENEIVLQDEKLKGTVSKAVSQMGLSIDDSLWRQLNYALLLKTKHQDHRVRLLSLKTVVEFARLIGEEYQSLLPETIPFISELMEDENAEVEKGCQKYILELEVIVKDSLQKYL